ncbi:protein toll-like isoform X2 [Maniola jurtina]|nr:protein toll-like isoform X2 [Maniola jurtina]
MSLRLLLLAAVVSAVADEPYYPLIWPGPERGCSGVAGQAEQLGAECALPGGRLTISADPAATYLRIECEDDSTFSCEDLEEAKPLITSRITAEHPAASRTVNKFEIKHCALPSEPLRCALRLARATGAKLLVLDDVPGAVTPRHVEGLTGLDKLRIYYRSGGNQSTVPYEVLAALPALSSFSLKRSAVVLRAGRTGAAGALPALRTLELSEGGVRGVPRGAFAFAPRLATLGLWGNEIEDVDEGAFDGLSSLENLSLNSNRLTSLPRALLRPCARLEHVDLYNNQLTSLPDDLFRGLVHLKKVIIFDNNATLHLPDHLFSNLPALQHLELRTASIQRVPEHLLHNSTSLQLLDLSRNQLTSIPTTMLHGLVKLRVLNLSNNKLAYLHQKLFLNLDKLEELDLKGNSLERLPEGVFAGLTALKVLKLGNNYINTLDKSLFSGLSELSELDLSGNRIQILNPETFSPISKLKILSLARNNMSITRQVNTFRFISPELYAQYQVDQASMAAGDYEYHSPLHALAQLSKLDLSHNRVALVCDDWRSLWNLHSLDLSYNALTELTGLDMVFLSDGLTVDFTYNNITHFAPPAAHYVQPPPRVAFLLHHNPLACDCRLFPYVHARRSGDLVGDLALHDAACARPPALRGVPLAALQPDQLVCDDSARPACPRNCTCLNRPSRARVEVSCPALPRDLPQQSSVTHLRLLQPSDLTQLPAHVKYVDLSALNLTTAPKTSHAVEIDLTNNNLTKIPVELLKLNCVLHLARNPIDCSCDNKVELEYLKLKHHLVKDYRNLTCRSNLSLSGVDTDALCAARDSTVIGFSVACIGILAAVLTGIAYQYSTEIRIVLHKIGVWPNKPARDEYEYDAFISFSHQDELYVINTLVPKLKSGRNPLKLCLHYENWVIGDFIPSQITRSVEQSRRTIIVLSEHFLKSDWAQMEFRAAHGRERLIVLMLDDLTSDKNLDPDLKAYVSTNTYVKASDPLVYDRLKYSVLHTSTSFGKKSKNVDRPAGLDVHLNLHGQLVNAYAA